MPKKQPIQKKFPANLRYFRQGCGWSQQDLADAVGVGLVTVNRWESDRETQVLPSVLRMEAIAKALGCTVGDLIS